jgi:hypothetical protein
MDPVAVAAAIHLGAAPALGRPRTEP